MTTFNFVAFGTVQASDASYADSDVRKALSQGTRITVSDVIQVPNHALCRGSEHPATTVEVKSDIDHPYNRGRCSVCGAYVPLLSAGNFEVIKHFAPSNYKEA